MSEYQYYEFQAIDRPLTDKQMQELRSYSTRARITHTSFVNDYSWGSFKGDADAWVEKYFDAFLYLANWGTHVLKLRLPVRLLDLKTAQQYCGGQSVWVHQKRGNVIVSFVSEDEEGEDWVEAEGRLSSLIPVRMELTCRDLRSLYLGWLLGVQNGEFDDEDTEPAVPPGLGQLSASLVSLAEFLRIDRDLLDVAAQASTTIKDLQPSHDQVQAWLAGLPAQEKDNALARLIVREDRTLAIELLHQFLEHPNRTKRPSDASIARRTVGALLEAAETRTERRQQIEARKRAEEMERREREAAIARAKHLDEIAGRQPQLWAQIDSLIATTKPKSYEQVISLLTDLRDLSQRVKKNNEFQRRVEAICAAHARKPAFIERLRKAGLR
jgi:FtsZ-interacting cell division protein YlmF